MVSKTSRSMLIPLALAMLLVGYGCVMMPKSATGPLFSSVPVPRGEAVVYFYRPDRLAGSASTVFMSIPLEADNCFAMDRAGYYAYFASPGTLRVAAGAYSIKQFAFNLKAGEEKYVRVEFGGFPPAVTLQEIPADEARPEIRQHRLIDKCER